MIEFNKDPEYISEGDRLKMLYYRDENGNIADHPLNDESEFKGMTNFQLNHIVKQAADQVGISNIREYLEESIVLLGKYEQFKKEVNLNPTCNI